MIARDRASALSSATTTMDFGETDMLDIRECFTEDDILSTLDFDDYVNYHLSSKRTVTDRNNLHAIQCAIERDDRVVVSRVLTAACNYDDMDFILDVALNEAFFRGSKACASTLLAFEHEGSNRLHVYLECLDIATCHSNSALIKLASKYKCCGLSWDSDPDSEHDVDSTSD